MFTGIRNGVLICLLFFYAKLPAQQIGHTSFTFVDTARNNRQVPTEIYYPATATGNNTPIAAGLFPLIVFGHGFVMTWSAYQYYTDMLVPEGYVLAFPTTESGFSPNHSDFANDLKFLTEKILDAGAGAVVPSTSIGPTSAVMGHSMGGGCSFLAAENNQAITTLISFAAANTNPSSVTAARNISIPVLIFSAGNDCVAPPSQHQDIMYDSTMAAEKTQIYISGGGHCYFADSNLNCTIGESTCSPSPNISRAAQQSVTEDFLKQWLAYYLKNDCQSADQFQDSLSVSARINYRQSQPIGCIAGLEKLHLNDGVISVFPNPFSKILTIEANEDLRNITLYDVMRERTEVGMSAADKKIMIDLSSLVNGIYFINVNNRYWKRIIKCSDE